MSENSRSKPWVLVGIGSLLTTALTTVFTVGGSFWLEQRKAKIDLAKDVSHSQAIALDKLDRDLTRLQGNMLYMFKLAQSSNSTRELEKQAIDGATVLADIFQDNKPLDDAFSSKGAIHELSESAAPVLASLVENPAKNATTLASYYSGEFTTKLSTARASLDSDRKRVVQPLP